MVYAAEAAAGAAAAAASHTEEHEESGLSCSPLPLFTEGHCQTCWKVCLCVCVRDTC